MHATEAGCLLAGRYRLTAVIGSGGMGVVWHGHDELLNRDVAVKEIIWPPHLTEQERQLACRRAVREAQMAGRLSHRNVVRIYDIVEEDGHPCIVMEFLPYQSLRDLIKEGGPIPPDRAARIGLGILAALAAAHEEGILHRDVKPANILVGQDGRVVLTDFGIARAADSPTLTGDGALLGSPSYIAPERATGGQPGAAGAPADLWGLGASLYTAVEGHPPFERNGPLATLTAIVADEPDPARHAGPLEPVISGLLKRDPRQRLSAAATERLLRQVAEPGPQPAAAPTPAAPTAAAPTAAAPRRTGTAGPRGPRGLAGALVALAVAAGAATGVGFILTSSPGRQAAAPGGSAHAKASPGTGHPASQAPSPGTRTSPAGSSPAGAPSQAQASPSASASPGGSGADGALPAGYHRFTNSTGFSIGVPDGWPISHKGHYVYLTDPSNSNVFLLIDQSSNPKPNPLADWRQQQADRAGSYPGYRLISLRSVNYPQAEAAADWQFTYDRNGVLVHILNRNVLANATHAYALYWSTPEGDWNADYHYFQAFAATFEPAAAQQAGEPGKAGNDNKAAKAKDASKGHPGHPGAG